jgi:hypothetical protein
MTTESWDAMGSGSVPVMPSGDSLIYSPLV